MDKLIAKNYETYLNENRFFVGSEDNYLLLCLNYFQLLLSGIYYKEVFIAPFAGNVQ